ncbi:GNAT family N-acetyltransferase [Endozoicomonas atrinae]|uniref:GNAT family N-acetyltransferase n=1 Tax=Endozoicomonas atrinae TaxID=1333660 RepID=UPI003B008DFF
MILETSRLRIREISESDLDNLCEMLADEKVMEFSVNGPMSKPQTLDFINWCQSSYNDHGIGPWALVSKIDGAFIGFAGLSKEFIDGVEEIHIGYRLARKYWNKGFATEAVSSIVDYGLSRNDQNRIYAIIEPEHCSSIRVIEKAGFNISKQTKFHEKLTNIYVKSNLQDCSFSA